MTKARKIQIILYSLLILGCIGLYLYDIGINHADPKENLMKMILIVVGCVLGLLRGNRKRGRASLSFYEKSYSNELGQAFSVEPKKRKALLKAVRLYNENQLKKALNILTGLQDDCRDRDDYFAVGLFRALCFTEMRQYEDAISEYQQLIARRLETGTVYNNLGHVFSKLGRKKEAMEYYKKALNLSPDNASAYVNIANMCFADRDFETAITYAKKALEINCNQKQAANLLAIVYALQEDKENADKYFHVAISCGSDPGELKHAIADYKAE